jgi:hypothetical protein
MSSFGKSFWWRITSFKQWYLEVIILYLCLIWQRKRSMKILRIISNSWEINISKRSSNNYRLLMLISRLIYNIIWPDLLFLTNNLILSLDTELIKNSTKENTYKVRSLDAKMISILGKESKILTNCQLKLQKLYSNSIKIVTES